MARGSERRLSTKPSVPAFSSRLGGCRWKWTGLKKDGTFRISVQEKCGCMEPEHPQ